MATKSVRVRVTKADIETGRPKSAACCPVAIALQRATGKKSCRIHWDAFRVGRFEDATPGAVQEFVSDFDAGRPVRPFSFTIKVPA